MSPISPPTASRPLRTANTPRDGGNYPASTIAAAAANALFRTDDAEGDDGGMKRSTVLGIVISLLCFFTILIVFVLISKIQACFVRLRPPPPADELAETSRNQQTVANWIYNLSKGKGRPPPQLTSVAPNGAVVASPYAIELQRTSTFSSDTTVTSLNPPARAYQRV